MSPGRDEVLGLERAYAREAREDADTFWRAGLYGLARELRREAEEAESYVKALEDSDGGE
jgi:hypothetical protein